MNCAVCQASLFAGDVFCVRCGTRVPAAVAAGEHSGQTRSMAAVASGATPAAAACPGCHEPVAPDDRYCQRCGHALAGPVAAADAPLAPASACPTCKAPVFADDIFCVRCGTRVAPEVVSATPASESAPSPLGDDLVIVRIAAVSTRDLTAALAPLLAPVPALLGDDPFARKW